MGIKEITIKNRDKYITFQYVTDDRRIKTLRERVVILGLSKITFLESAISISIHKREDLSIIATLQNNTEVNVNELLEIHNFMNSYEGNKKSDSYYYDQSIIALNNTNNVSITTRLNGGYIVRDTNCIVIPTLYSLKKWIYEDYLDWLPQSKIDKHRRKQLHRKTNIAKDLYRLT